MQPDSPVRTWLDLLRHLMPARGVVHIGAGSGASAEVFRRWEVPYLLLVDADPAHQRKLGALVEGRSGWSAQLALVGETDADTPYFVASNPNESGLLPPDTLTPVWQNLKTREERRLPAVTLDRLLTQAGIQDVNWVMVDCLPALRILRGATSTLATAADVVLVRTILDEDLAPGQGAALSEVRGYLADRGFQFAASEQERHPSLGLALFVRDWKKLHESSQRASHLALEESSVAQESLTKQVGDLAIRLEAQQNWNEQLREVADKLTLSQGETRAQLEQAGLQLQTLAREQEEAGALADRRQQDASLHAAELERQLREQQALAATREAELTTLIAERSRLERLAADGAERVEQLTREIAVQASQAAEHQQEIAQARKERSEMEQLADARQLEVELLKQGQQEQASALAALETNVAKLTQQLEEQIRVAQERGLEIQALIKSRDEQTLLADQRYLQVQDLTKARDEREQLANERYLEIQEARQARAEAEIRLNNTNVQLEQIERKEGQLLDELREARKTASMSVRLQALREADLKDLQIRYQTSVSVQERQHQLLTKLSERLAAAAAHFHQLSLDDQSATTSIAVRTPIDASARRPKAVNREREAQAPEPAMKKSSTRLNGSKATVINAKDKAVRKAPTKATRASTRSGAMPDKSSRKRSA